jgi:Abortive infection C-terminus
MVGASGAPIDGEVAAAVSKFFHGGAGPSHSEISRVLIANGYGDDYRFEAGGVAGPNKEQRVLQGFAIARRSPGRARAFVDDMLGLLRLAALIGDVSEPNEDEKRLRLALSRTGWYLTDDGQLRAFAGVDINTGGRKALDEQVARLRRSTADASLLIGTAKDLLEAVAKYVLEETEMPYSPKLDFGGLWYLARERLGIHPKQVDPDIPGFEAVRAIHQSTWSIAEQVNTLRNVQGTGHGRTLPTGITEELAMLVVREAYSVAEYILALLDKTHGRSK